MSDFKPFENDSQSTTVGPGNGFTFENGLDKINVYGDLEITPETDSKEIDDLIDVLTDLKKVLESKNKNTVKAKV